MNDDDLRNDITDAYYQRESQEANEQLWMLGIVVLLILGAVLYGTHWLDSHFHWHLEQWVRHQLHLK